MDIGGAPGGAEAAGAAMLEALMEAEQNQEALRNSLEGVMYKVTFQRPASAGGAAAGKSVQLELEPLLLAEEAQALAELELFGQAGREPVFMVYQGRPIPPQDSLFDAGIEDNSTIVLEKEL